MAVTSGAFKLEEAQVVQGPSFSAHGTKFQENLVQIILDDSTFAAQIGEVLDVNFLELKYLKLFAQKIYDYRKKYGVHPGRDTISSILRSDISNESEVVQKQVREYYSRILSNDGVEGQEYVKDVSLDFCKKQKLKEAMIKSVELIKSSSFDEVSKVINDALKHHGYDYLADFEKRFIVKARDPISTGWDLIDNITRGGLGRRELGVVIASTGCHAAGTPILMLDGSLKNVEDIILGDKLIGPDSKVRNVLNLHRGQELMYRIVPVKGESFVVNAGHILSLRHTQTDEIINISVRDYINKTNHFKHLYKLYRSNAITFENNNDKKLYSYYVGCMLGDGSIRKGQISFTTADEEIINEIKTYKEVLEPETNIKAYFKKDTRCASYVLSCKNNGVVASFFKDLGLFHKLSEEKFIPQEYKVSAIEDRLELLAGLMDTDGSMSHNGFDYISKSQQLANDVVFVARSVGLSATIRSCVKSCQTGASGIYYRVSISGDCSIIPTRLERKKAGIRKQIKNVLNTGFTVEEANVGEYYGFEVDNDNLYVMGDFTVTHNSGKSQAMVHMGSAALKQGKNVIYYTLELQDTVVASRFDACITGININDLPNHKEHVLEGIKNVKGKLIVKEYPSKSASTVTIKNHLEKLKNHGFTPDMIIVDYADLLRPAVREKEKRQELESIYEELRGIAQMFDCTMLTCSQTNRSAINAEVITMEAISEAFNKCFVADFICTISRTLKDKASNEGRMYIAKNRNGPDGMVFPLYADYKNVTIKVLQESTESASEIITKSMKEQEATLKEKYRKFKKEQAQ